MNYSNLSRLIKEYISVELVDCVCTQTLPKKLRDSFQQPFYSCAVSTVHSQSGTRGHLQTLGTKFVILNAPSLKQIAHPANGNIYIHIYIYI